MGVVVVYAFFYPNQRMLFYGFFPVTVKWLAIIYVLMDLLALGGPPDGVGHAAHLGGAATGLCYYLLDFRIFSRKRRMFFEARRWWGGSRPKQGPPQESADRPIDSKTDARMDELLQKISQGGMSALTEEERDYLKQASRKYREDD